jgi:predicted enzyme related to lactoylglutathione lyase
MNFVSWFEIPVYDIHRAATFYNALYGFQMELSQNGEHTMALFPPEAGVGGALVAGPGCVASDAGVLVYLNATVGLDIMLERVQLAGGRVLMPRSFISEETGSFALFIDSEGNRLALHEPPVVVPRVSPPTAPAATRKRSSSKGSKSSKSSISASPDTPTDAPTDAPAPPAAKPKARKRSRGKSR